MFKILSKFNLAEEDNRLFRNASNFCHFNATTGIIYEGKLL